MRRNVELLKWMKRTDKLLIFMTSVKSAVMILMTIAKNLDDIHKCQKCPDL